jgi:hypothetical protein
MKNLLLIALVSVSRISSGPDFCKKFPANAVCQKSPLELETNSLKAPTKKVKLSQSTKKAIADSLGLKDPKKIDTIVDVVMTVTNCTSDEYPEDEKTTKIIQNQIPNASKSQVNTIKQHIANAQNTINPDTFIEQNTLAIAKLINAKAKSTDASNESVNTDSPRKKY